MTVTIGRRELLVALGGAAVAWPLLAGAQQPALPVIGFLNPASHHTFAADFLRGFHRGLKDNGYVEGENVAIEYRWAEGQFDRLPAMTADLIGRKVAVLFVSPDVAVRTAMSSTKTIPIVFVTASDPVAAGFVPSLGRPGGNITGITMLGVELVAKRLELLHELLPGATRIALLVNPNNPDITQNTIQHSEAAARRLGLQIVVLKAGTESEIESAIATAVQQQADALSIAPDAYLSSRNRQIAFFALRPPACLISARAPAHGGEIFLGAVGAFAMDSYAARAWGGQPIAPRRLRFSAGPRLPAHERSCSRGF